MKKKLFAIMLCGILMFGLSGCAGKKSEESNNKESKTEKSKEKYSIEDNKIFFLKVNGKNFKVGDKISDLEKAGFSLKENAKNTSIPKNRYLLAQSVVDKNGNEVFDVIPINLSDDKILAKDATIAAYTTYKYSKGYKTYEFIVDDSGIISQIKWNNYDK